MRCHLYFLAFLFPLSACDTMHGAHYSAPISAMPEPNCVSNALNTVIGVSDVNVSVRSSRTGTQVLPTIKKFKYNAEVVNFSYKGHPFTVESSGNDREMTVRLGAHKIGSCPSPERMKSFFEIQRDVTQALSRTCFKEARFNRPISSRKECPVASP